MRNRSIQVIAAAFMTVSIAYAIRYGYGMLLPGMLDSLQITKTEAGIIYGTYFAAYTVFSPILGLLADRYDSRLIITFFSGVMAAGAFVMGWADSLPKALLFFAIAGVGHAACWAPVVSLVQHWVSDKNRGAALAFATMGSGVGIAFWSMVLPIIVERLSWQHGWMFMGVFGFFVTGLNYLLLRNPPVGDSAAPAHHVLGSYLQLMGRKELWLIGISYLLVGFTVLVPFTFLSVYGTEDLQMSYSFATRLFAILAVAGIVGKLIMGIMSDRYGRIPFMMVCGGLLGAGCLGLVNLGSIQMKIFSIVLIGLGFGAVWPVYAAAAVDFFPKSASGTVIGIWTVFLGVGSILSPVVCGWSIDFSGAYSLPFNIGAATAIGSVLALVPMVRR